MKVFEDFENFEICEIFENYEFFEIFVIFDNLENFRDFWKFWNFECFLDFWKFFELLEILKLLEISKFSEVLKILSFLNFTIFEILQCFEIFLVHGTISREIRSFSFLPLFKGAQKNLEKLDSYRAISRFSQLLKLFECVILILWGRKPHESVDSLQFGFKKGMSWTQCILMMTEVTNHLIEKERKVTTCFLGCNKAFDKFLFKNNFWKWKTKTFLKLY